MRYKNYILLLLCLFATMTYGQRMWQSIYTTIGGPHHNFIRVCEDTVIVNEEWSILKVEKYNYWTQELLLSGRLGYMKEENGIVEFMDANLTDRGILYNYNLEVGDTILAGLLFGPLEFRVTDVSFKDVNGASRKQLTLKNDLYGYEDIWIEGIGSIKNDFIFSGEPDDIIDAGTSLVCYRQNDDISSWDSSVVCQLDTINISCGNITTSLTEQKEIQKHKIYPNPFKNEVSIEASHKIKRVEVYNIRGSLMKSVEVLNDEIDISLDGNSHEMLILKIVDLEGHAEYHKILKQSNSL